MTVEEAFRFHVAARVRAYYLAYPEKKRAADRAYRLKHRARINAQRLKYYAAHKSKIKAQKKVSKIRCQERRDANQILS